MYQVKPNILKKKKKSNQLVPKSISKKRIKKEVRVGWESSQISNKIIKGKKMKL